MGAGWASRRWPIDRYAELARYLGERYHLRSVVAWAGSEERQWADQVIVSAGGFAHMAPPTSLSELARLCRRATFFVGNDTGPMHLAVALGTPCVSLHGPTNALRNGPYGDDHIALQRVLLTGGSRERRGADNSSMQAISLAEVCAACDTLITPQEHGQLPKSGLQQCRRNGGCHKCRCERLVIRISFVILPSSFSSSKFRSRSEAPPRNELPGRLRLQCGLAANAQPRPMCEAEPRMQSAPRRSLGARESRETWTYCPSPFANSTRLPQLPCVVEVRVQRWIVVHLHLAIELQPFAACKEIVDQLCQSR